MTTLSDSVAWKRSTFAAALTATLGIAAVCWVIALRQMDAMDMGVETRLGSFAFFIGLWVSMMGAMMLPAATPALARHVRGVGLRSAPLFVASYLAVWGVVGLVVYALYRTHGTTVAGTVVIAAGLYELTPVKRHFRHRCQERVRDGLDFGLCCVGSSIGLMAMLVALGVMSGTWMSVIAVVVLVQKLMPPRAAVDVALASAIVGIGVLIILAPSAAPGLM
jgi:predicted metal-binding membrane protein